MADLSGLVSELEKIGLPLLGAAVGGPAGAGIGESIAKALGCDNSPDAIQTAMKTDPDAAVKLATIENQYKMAQLAYQTHALDVGAAQVDSVNKTLQTEAMGGSFWQKNHHAFESSFTVVWLFAEYFILPLVGIPVPAIPTEVFVMVTAILGVTAFMRGKANQAAAQNSILGGNDNAPN